MNPVDWSLNVPPGPTRVTAAWASNEEDVQHQQQGRLGATHSCRWTPINATTPKLPVSDSPAPPGPPRHLGTPDLDAPVDIPPELPSSRRPRRKTIPRSPIKARKQGGGSTILSSPQVRQASSPRRRNSKDLMKDIPCVERKDSLPGIPQRVLSPVATRSASTGRADGSRSRRGISGFFSKNDMYKIQLDDLQSDDVGDVKSCSGVKSRASMEIFDGYMLKSAMKKPTSSQDDGSISSRPRRSHRASVRRHHSTGFPLRHKKYSSGSKRRLRRRKTVRFPKERDLMEKVFEVQPQLALVDYDKEVLWCQQKELNERKLKIREILRNAHMYQNQERCRDNDSSSGYDEGSDCLRGIECHFEDEVNERDIVLDMLYDNVLTTQEIQRSGGHRDSFQLAAFSERISVDSRRKALERALHDALEVAEAFDDDHKMDESEVDQMLESSFRELEF